MQNVALSLLSGTINIGFSNFSENLLYVNSTCENLFEEFSTFIIPPACYPRMDLLWLLLCWHGRVGIGLCGGTILVGSLATGIDGSVYTFALPSFIQVVDSQLTYIGGLGSFLANGNFAWRENMTLALEEYAQNLTLSLLSGQIFPFNNTEETSLLENSTTECVYTIDGSVYTPYRLLLTYGIAAFVTLLCVAWGTIAIRINGTEESMNFSRFLRAVLNERMYHWYEGEGFKLDMNARIKADETSEGALAPVFDDSGNSFLQPENSIPLIERKLIAKD